MGLIMKKRRNYLPKDWMFRIMCKFLCPKCLRQVPSEEWITKKGCIWCDSSYHKGVKK